MGNTRPVPRGVDEFGWTQSDVPVHSRVPGTRVVLSRLAKIADFPPFSSLVTERVTESISLLKDSLKKKQKGFSVGFTGSTGTGTRGRVPAPQMPGLEVDSGKKSRIFPDIIICMVFVFTFKM